MKRLHVQKRFTGSFYIEDENSKPVALMTDDYYQDEKLARLMASAPELLEALEAANAALRKWEWYSPNDVDDLDRRAFAMIAKAVAKVKGE